MKLLAVVIPAKDEETSIGKLLDRVAHVRVTGYRMRAVVVDDAAHLVEREACGGRQQDRL